MQRQKNYKFYSQRTQDQIRISARLNESYRRLNTNHNSYFSSISDSRRGSLLVDTNLFYPLRGEILTFPLIIDDLEEHRIYNLSERELLERATSYKRTLKELLEKTPNLHVTEEVYHEILAETGYWKGRVQVLECFKFNIKDPKKRSLIERLISFGRKYSQYLEENHIENRSLIRNRIAKIHRNRNNGFLSELEKKLSNLGINCTDVDKNLVLHAFVNGFEEDLTLVSSDHHILMLMEGLTYDKKVLEDMMNKNVSIHSNRFWHGYMTYIFDFINS
ncbi:MAG: hypothetical protein AABW56_01305 [Nanoarchaeota archaeon]